MPSVLWRDSLWGGLERCALDPVPGGFVLQGTAIRPLDGAPLEIRYRVETDAAWLTRAVEVSVAEPGGERRLVLSPDGRGSWTVDGAPVPPVEGCLDVDLQFTPATNTLPIRRLELPVGDHADVSACWVRFPELTVERLEQRYTRTGSGTYVYSTPRGFRAELEVDPDGLVRRYGDYWEAVAAG